MLTLETVKEILDIKEEELKEVDIEKLRDILGVLHLASRLVEHEIDSRESV